MAKTSTQTTKIDGRRVRIITTTGANGTKVKIQDAPVLEWEMQSEQCRRLKAMPEYGKRFLLIGGMEAGRRGKQEQVKAKATGLTAGHPDLTIFLPSGKIAMIENKAANGRLSPEQKDRHAALKAIGHTVEVVKASSKDEAAKAAVALVVGWLAENDNNLPLSLVA
ncbi:VRR-NUC domain-containing protein [Rhizobium laguerreae]|uniref:VRR-NUC domain-containing protein n=1 Tax=Rhizobium laguerreae TaxID=1076926 RepID=UPI001C907C95|nr:VRR-NUC domain-containing protein [Rhizobium laguerreae]MBY3434841.1 VRR-NUC domain-containing protein [Rhizobium laguerreae]MBY3448984.1 VRR-NUC domain-containing protein [Rhizobium laguerreae]MBY3456758.1 VRR-NUC domain-containing protein [Rhizobium laguerreae]